ncbi:hypothetical protein ZIOFF_023784 [Zingiber officinale]|uniref:Gamma-tubulin complex component n=1 Tax=Zingiber officinale TaxID=94328 RepID=A0A8J5LCJ9_ZINOF|nr:hypothetical protein ZIOFF_023784 [Zingiber officinale]
MLHELLLALLGFTGDFVIDEREQAETLGLDSHHQFPEEPTFKLAPDLSFLHPSERSLIERLVSLGFYYKELDQFATKSRNLSFIHSAKSFSLSQDLEVQKDKVRKGSAYRRTVANGLVEILSVYRAAVLQIEQNLLSDPLPILATVTQGLNKFEVLLPPLYELVVEIEREDIRGGQLLNLLHKRCHCGVPELQACIQRQDGRSDDSELSHSEQIKKFMEKSADDTTLTDWHSGFHISLIEHFSRVEFKLPFPLPNFILSGTLGLQFVCMNYETKHSTLVAGDLDVNGLIWCSSTHPYAQAQGGETRVSKVLVGGAPSISNSASLRGEMLPEYIHMRVAESILFAGKAVRVLRNPTTNFRLQESFMRQLVLKGSSRVQSYIETFSSQREVSPAMNLIAEDLLPQSEADKIDAMLKELKKSSEFQKRLFESAVGSIRIIAANHLWQLVVVRADLNGHLKALKDYFLLAKGDFFQCFLEESRQLMRLPPRQSTAEADLMVPFQLAALKTVGDEDKYFSRVSLRMPSFGINVSTSQVDLKTKSVAMTIPSQGKTSSESSVDGWDGMALEYSVDWPLQLFFTQEVISKYRKVDVIESQWNLLQAHLQDSHDFTELVGFHQEYLAALISQSFLDIGSVSRILDSIMKLCLQFCWSIEQYEGNANMSELEHIAEEFNKKSNSLYTILRSSRLAGSQRAPFLRQFLMRLNFNSFFEEWLQSAGGFFLFCSSFALQPSVPWNIKQTRHVWYGNINDESQFIN